MRRFALPECIGIPTLSQRSTARAACRLALHICSSQIALLRCQRTLAPTHLCPNLFHPTMPSLCAHACCRLPSTLHMRPRLHLLFAAAATPSEWPLHATCCRLGTRCLTRTHVLRSRLCASREHTALLDDPIVPIRPNGPQPVPSRPEWNEWTRPSDAMPYNLNKYQERSLGARDLRPDTWLRRRTCPHVAEALTWTFRRRIGRLCLSALWQAQIHS